MSDTSNDTTTFEGIGQWRSQARRIEAEKQDKPEPDDDE